MAYVFRQKTHLCNTCCSHPEFSAQSLVTTVPNITSKTLNMRYWYSLSYHFKVCRHARIWPRFIVQNGIRRSEDVTEGRFQHGQFCEDTHNPSFFYIRFYAKRATRCFIFQPGSRNCLALSSNILRHELLYIVP